MAPALASDSAGPAHPLAGNVRVIAELLGHPLAAAATPEPPDGRGDRNGDHVAREVSEGCSSEAKSASSRRSEAVALISAGGVLPFISPRLPPRRVERLPAGRARRHDCSQSGPGRIVPRARQLRDHVPSVVLARKLLRLYGRRLTVKVVAVTGFLSRQDVQSPLVLPCPRAQMGLVRRILGDPGPGSRGSDLGVGSRPARHVVGETAATLGRPPGL